MHTPTIRADDIDHLVDIITPAGVEADYVGAAILALAKRGLIARVPCDPENVRAGGRHSALLRRWRLAVDHVTARRWMAAHPIPREAEPADHAQ